MLKIKTFVISAEPTGRTTKDLGTNIDKTVNDWLKENEVEDAEVTVAADLAGSYGRAVVVIKYQGEADEEPETVDGTEDEGKDGDTPKKRGRKSKDA